MARNIPDPTDGWADGRSSYLWDKQLDGVLRLIRGVAHPDVRRRSVRRMLIGLVFVVLLLVVAPLVAIFVASK